MTEDIQLKMEKNLAVIELHQPNSLILSQKHRDHFRSCVEKIIQSPSIHVALLMFKPKGFYLNEPLKSYPSSSLKGETKPKNSKHHNQHQPNGFDLSVLIEQIEKIHGRERWEKLLDEIHDLFDLIETANVSWVAAIQGACLGHPLELALTCDYRIADFIPNRSRIPVLKSTSSKTPLTIGKKLTETTKNLILAPTFMSSAGIKQDPYKMAGLGLPDLSLGLMPCFGACIRMPRLIGLRRALKMILNSQVISSREAYHIGLIYKVVHPLDLEKQARVLAEQIIKGHIPPKPRQQYKPIRLLDKCFEAPIVRQILYYITKKKILSETKGFYPAPLKVLEVIKNTYPVIPITLENSELKKISTNKTQTHQSSFPFKNYIKIIPNGYKHQKTALKEESDAFCDLMVSPITRHLISLHLVKDKIIPKQYKDRTTQINMTSNEKIKKIAIIGAGTMGAGITHWLAHYPTSILLKDIHPPSLSTALKMIYSQNIPTQKIRPQMDYSGFHNVDLVIETVVEDLEIKKKVINQVASHTSNTCLFATNTSSFKVTELAKAHPDPSRFFGLHFFYPTYRTHLVEIVQGEHSSNDTIISAAQWISKLDKIPFLVKDSPGFLVQRLFLPLMLEAFWFLKEGINIEQVDQIYKSFGFSMGPFRLIDELGLNICLKLIKSMSWKKDEDFPQDIFKLRPIFLGRKNKNGFYIYDKNGKVESVNNLIYKDLQFKPASQDINKEECLERGLYRIINEAAQVLEEQLVATPKELDLALVLGIGFPAFRGGLLKYADEISLKTITTRLAHLSKTKGERFCPSRALLTQLDKEGAFYK